MDLRDVVFSGMESIPDCYFGSLAARGMLCSSGHHIGIFWQLVCLGILVVPLRACEGFIFRINIERLAIEVLCARLPCIVCHFGWVRGRRRDDDPLTLKPRCWTLDTSSPLVSIRYTAFRDFALERSQLHQQHPSVLPILEALLLLSSIKGARSSVRHLLLSHSPVALLHVSMTIDHN